MIDVKGYKIGFDFSHFRKIADLIELDGPFLSHYVSPSGDDYLFYWIDCDEEFNRWLVLRVGLPRLQQYISHQIPLRELVENPSDGFLYMVDINHELEYKNVQLVLPSSLPEEYLPAADAFYEFEVKPVGDIPEMMTYELTIPYREQSRLEQFLTLIDAPLASLKRMATTAAVF